MTEGAPLVLDLLNYIEQVEKLKSKPPFSVPTEFFVAYQHELKGLPELQFNVQVEGDDVWLRIPRLQEIAAPELDEALEPWVTLPQEPREAAGAQERDRRSGTVSVRSAARSSATTRRFSSTSTGTWRTSGSPGRRPSVRGARRSPATTSCSRCSRPSHRRAPKRRSNWSGASATPLGRRKASRRRVKYPLLVQSLRNLAQREDVRPRDSSARRRAAAGGRLLRRDGATGRQAARGLLAQRARHRRQPRQPVRGVHLRRHPEGRGRTPRSLRSATRSAPTTSRRRHRRDKLKITNTWVLFGRKRSGDIFLEDIRRLKKKVEDATTLPSVIRSLVERGDSTVQVRPEQPFRGLSTSDGGSQTRMELYFPMAYNDEQVSIVQKLHANDGVVVQGPPGTGKTHTIANVICHYLAQGKRVLVTAKGESALAVLQEKLPERHPPAQRRAAVGRARRHEAVRALDPDHRVERGGAQSDAGRGQHRAQLRSQAEPAARQDFPCRPHRGGATPRKHMRKHTFQGREVTPEEMAKAGAAGRRGAPVVRRRAAADQGRRAAIRRRRRQCAAAARMKVGDDLVYLDCSLPAPDDFPAWIGPAGAASRPRQGEVHRGQRHPRQPSSRWSTRRLETFEKAQALVKFLERPHGAEGQACGQRQAAVARRALASASPTCSRATRC